MTTPQKATPSGSGQANADQEIANISIVVDIGAARKEYAMLQAQAAPAGHVLLRLDDESPTLREVGDMLRRIGAAI